MNASLLAARLPGRTLSKVARHHVTHFLVGGAILFGLAPWPESDRDVHLSKDQLDALYGLDARRTGQPLDTPRRVGVETRAIEDEILYREALRLGLDKGDGVVRQRLIQKVIFLAEDLGGAAQKPKKTELLAYYEATREQWQSPEKFRFIQVFLAPGIEHDVAELKVRLAAESAGDSQDSPPNLGDAFGLARSLTASQEEIAQDYGKPFAEAISSQPLGVWSEPLASRFGTHLVKVIGKEAPRQQTFEEALPKMRLSFLVHRKEQATQTFLKTAFERYRVDIDGQLVATYSPSGRPSPDRKPEED